MSGQTIDQTCTVTHLCGCGMAVGWRHGEQPPAACPSCQRRIVRAAPRRPELCHNGRGFAGSRVDVRCFEHALADRLFCARHTAAAMERVRSLSA